MAESSFSSCSARKSVWLIVFFSIARASAIISSFIVRPLPTISTELRRADASSTPTTTTTTNSGGSSVTSKPTKLAAPEMEWHGDDYTWKAVAHADYYYFHYGSDKVKVTGLTYTFNPKVDFNGKVYVTACSNNPLYLESDESNFIWISVLA